LAHPIIALIYQHGRFSARDTDQTALALQAYSVGLAGYAAIKVLVPCFYALGQPRTPLRISLIGIGVNLTLNLIGFEVLHLGHAGLALTTSCVALINFAQLAFALRKHVDIGDVRQWVSYLARCLLASVSCGLAAWAVDHWLEHVFRHGPLTIVALAIAVGAGVSTYFAAAHVLQLSESAQAWRMIRRRLPGGARG